jgi:hypothetical protein
MSHTLDIATPITTELLGNPRALQAIVSAELAVSEAFRKYGKRSRAYLRAKEHLDNVSAEAGACISTL